MKKTKLLTLLASIFLLAGCSSTAGGDEEPVEVSEVKVNPTAVVIAMGEEPKTVNYNVFGKGAFSKEVEITSENDGIASVKVNENNSFAISPVSVGHTKVNVKSKADESKAASVDVTINPEKIIVVTPEVTAVKASSSGLELPLGSTPQSITVTVEGKGEYDKGVEVVSSKPEIATVNKAELSSGDSFEVAPVSEGNTDIIITSKGDKTKGAMVPVLVSKGGVIPPEVDITLNPISKEIAVEESFDLVATTTGTEENVSWDVEGEDGIVSLTNTSNEGATVTGLATGEVKVNASVEGKSASSRVKVTTPTSYTKIQLKVNGGEPIEMVKSSETPEGLVSQFTYTFASIAEDARIDFYGKIAGDFALITENIEPDGDDIAANIQNNLKPITIGGVDWAVLKEGTNVTLYFNVSEDGVKFWLQGGPEIPEPVRSVSINGGTHFILAKDDREGEVAEKHQYSVDIPVTKNDELKFYVDDVEITKIGADRDQTGALVTGNNFEERYRNEELYFAIHSSFTPEADGKSIYLKEYEDGGYSVWVNGYHTNPAALMGLAGDFKVGQTMTLNDEQTEYSIKNVHLTKEDAFKVEYNCGWFGDESVKLGCKDLVADPDEYGNIKLKNEGDYDIYWSLTAEEGKTIWIEEHVPSVVGYEVKVNGSEVIELTKNEEVKGQYTHLFESIAKDATIDFYSVYDDETKVLISTNIAPNGDNTEKNIQNNLKPVTLDGTDWTVLKDATDATLYFEVSTTGYGFWLEGGPEIPEPVFKASLNGGEPVELTLDDGSKPSGVKHQYSTNVAVAKNDEIAFYKDNVKLNVSAGESGNNIDVRNEKLYIHAPYAPEVDKYSISLKLLESGSYEAWGHGRTNNPVALMGLEGDYKVGTPMEIHESKPSECIIRKVSLTTEDAIKVEDNGTWYGNEAVKSGCASLLASPDEYGNIKMKDAGVYDIMWDSVADGEGKSIWIQEYVPSVVGYEVKLNDSEVIALTKNEENASQYTHLFESISKDTRIDFYSVYDDETKSLIATNITPSDDDVEHNTQNNLKPATAEGVDFTVLKDANNAKLYFKIDDSNYSFWLEGGPEIPVTSYKVKLNGTDVHELVANDTSLPSGVKHQFSSDVELIKNDKLKFYKGDTELTVSLSSGDNNAYLRSGDISVYSSHKPEEGHYSIDLKIKDDNSLELWVHGKTNNPVALMGVAGDYKVGMTMSINPDNNKECMIKGVSLTTTDAIKVEDNCAWYGFEAVKEGCKGLLASPDEDGNIKVLAEGIYNVYWNFEEAKSGPSIWISKVTPSITFVTTSITVEPDEVPVSVGVTAVGVSDINYVSDNACVEISSSSSDKEVIFVPKSSGSAVITASANEGAVTATLTVTVHAHSYDPSTHECSCGQLDPDYAKFTLKVKSNTKYGQDLYLVGDFTEPTWLDGKIAMTYVSEDEYHWQVSIVVPKNTTIEYKIVMIEGGNVTWMADPNRREENLIGELTVSFEYNFN